ncbi:MAG: thioredoxin family protein [Clostridium sp.]
MWNFGHRGADTVASVTGIETDCREYPDLTLVQVNIDDYEELSDRYGVETIPCMMVFHDEKPSTPLIAPQAKAQVITWMKEQKAAGIE